MIDEKILSKLRNNTEYVSGEELCKTADISRAAIWKHIEKLRDEGYGIEASPHLGYRLLNIPDSLIAVGERRGDDELALPSHFHTDDAFVPTLNHLPCAKRKREAVRGFRVVSRGIKDSAVGERPDIIYRYAVARRGNGASTDNFISHL